jgi:hypothetical protein
VRWLVQSWTAGRKEMLRWWFRNAVQAVRCYRMGGRGERGKLALVPAGSRGCRLRAGKSEAATER